MKNTDLIILHCMFIILSFLILFILFKHDNMERDKRESILYRTIHMLYEWLTTEMVRTAIKIWE